MAHGDAVIHGNGVEFFRHTTGRFNLAGDKLAQIFQMHMARHKLREAVDHGDNRLTEIGVAHAGGAPQAARARHIASMRRSSASQFRHLITRFVKTLLVVLFVLPILRGRVKH